MKFYDTSAILLDPYVLMEEPFATSSIVVNELENIKSSKTKTDEVRAAARMAARFIKSNQDCHIVLATNEHAGILDERCLPRTNDNLIVATAYTFQNTGNDMEFVTNDIVLSVIAHCLFGMSVSCVSEYDSEHYTGFKKLIFSDEEMAHFYEHLDQNDFEFLTNEYAVICSSTGDVKDVVKWDGNRFVNTQKKTLKTLAFGDKIKPRDCFQQMAIDTILANTVSIISGKAGSGKSLISLVASMYLIETGKYDRLIILFNPTSVRGASRLGYYSGDMVEKAMQTSIGNILTTKFGDRCEVDALIKQDKIRLVSMADMRGFEVRDTEILYITEAQNTSVDLLKLCLSRASQRSKIIIEGDYSNQVDDRLFEGKNNGMRRAIEVLKGEEIFGCVELQNVWRSKIAELAEKM